MSTYGNDNPFASLVGTESDPFSPAAPGAPPVVAAAPDPSAPAPPPRAPGFVPEAAYTALKTEVDRLKPLENLAWIGEAMQDPQVAARLRSAIYNGAGAPPPAAGVPAGPPPGDAIKARYTASIQQKMAEGDVTGAMTLSAEMGAELARASFMPELQSAAGPLLAMTASNAIENFCTAKRATSALFPKIEAKFRQFVAQTPPAALAQLTQSGGLNAALESSYNIIVGQTYDQAYTANAPIVQARLAPPPYGGGGGGPSVGLPDTPTDDDKDDAVFTAWAKERGITFTGGPNGAIVGEVK